MTINNGGKYLRPYFILCTVNLILNMLYIRARDGTAVALNWTKHFVVGILYSRGTREWMPNCSPLWFLTSLFAALFIYELIDYAGNQGLKIILIAAGAVFSYLLAWQDSPKLIWNIDSALMAIPFIEFGHQIRMRLCNGWEMAQRNRTVFMLVLMLLYVICVKYNTETVSFDNNRYGDALFMFCGALAATAGLFYLSIVYLDRANFFSWIGRHTIFVVGFDYFSKFVAEWTLNKVNLYGWFSLFISKMILLIIGVFIWGRIIKIFPKKIERCLRF